MPTTFDGVIEELEADERLGPQLVERLTIPGQPARHADYDLPEPLTGALARGGVERLWSHQVDGLRALHQGRDVLVTTPTASGKSLIFHLPVLERVLEEGEGRALFLYPLKALGQDQKGKFDALAEAAGLGDRATCAIYDGDTPRGERRRILAEPPRVVISNPDMLHLGILPHWQKWEPFLESLSWVVLDELHTYRGIFGCHFHHVLCRLARISRALGAEPRFVASSATAENAADFARALAGREFERVPESGAPREDRQVLLVQPASSPYTTTLDLLVFLLERGLKTIVFTKARRITELLYKWLKQQAPDVARKVANYRSGFLPEERREIERALFEGRLEGVISTSALEMGIDVGGLDACILVGYPGSVMATWQRAGRVGRSGRPSITALVALPDALDQYFLARPRALVERPLEHLIVDPSNEPVSRAHLECAAAERPLDRKRDASYLEAHGREVEALLDEGVLVESADGDEIVASRRRPHRKVNLRGGGGQTFTVLDAERDRVIGTVDGVRVLRECHLGAIYLHAGRQFLVRELDFEGHKVHAEHAAVDYFTTPTTDKQTEILEILGQSVDGRLAAWLGRLRVTERVTGFERKRIRGQDVLSRHRLDLPPVSYETVGLWFAAPPAIEETVRGAGEHFMGSLHAAEHAAISLLPLVALCDRGDVGGISIPHHPQVRSGVIFVYDGHAGGVGITRRVFAELPELLDRVAELLASCDCEEGCPSCVVSPKCGNGNRPLDKTGARHCLELLRGRADLAEGIEWELPAPEWSDPDWEPPPPPGRDEEDDDRHIWSDPDEDAPGRGSVPPPPGLRQSEPPRSDLPRGNRDHGRAPAWLEPSGWQTAGARGEVRSPGDGAIAEPPTVARPAAKGSSLDDRGPVFAGPPRPRRSVRTVLFDLETQRSSSEVGGWSNPHRMLVAVGVLCHLQDGRFETFFEDRTDDLIDRLSGADLVVGFNVRRFDYRVLEGYTGIDYNRKLPTLDLLEEIWRRTGRRIGLNDLARETLGAEKSADGLQSLEWVRQGRLDLVEAYCRRDVEILRDLYLFGRRMGYILYRDRDDRSLKLRVDW